MDIKAAERPYRHLDLIRHQESRAPLPRGPSPVLGSRLRHGAGLSEEGICGDPRISRAYADEDVELKRASSRSSCPVTASHHEHIWGLCVSSSSLHQRFRGLIFSESVLRWGLALRTSPYSISLYFCKRCRPLRSHTHMFDLTAIVDT